MSDIDQEITPALTPEQWAIIEADKGHATEERADLLGKIDQAGRVAAYNALLPNDDPRKITRADVQLIADVTSMIRDEEPELTNLRTLAAKLAALLPPEE